MTTRSQLGRLSRARRSALAGGLGLLALASTLPLACGPDFTSCHDYRNCPRDSAGAGGVSDGGGDEGGTAGSPRMGDAGAAGVAGGGGDGGRGDAGRGGDDAGGGTGGAAIGGGGAAGEAGSPEAGGVPNAGVGGAGGVGGMADAGSAGFGGGGADACSPNPCNSGKCILHIDSFLCECPMAYTGENCELPRFEGLGFLLGDTASFALDVSGDGRVVVGRSSIQVATARIETPFIWTHATGMQALVTFTGRATATNSDGSVVVGTRAEGRAFRWIAGKGVTELGAPAGATSSAIDTSEDGAVVVGTSTDPSAGTRAFRWTQASGLELLDSSISSVTGVSSNGSVVVGSRVLATGQVTFRWSMSGGFVDFSPADATFSSAQAMTSDGTVVFGLGSFSGVSQLFRWSADQVNVAQFLRIPATISDAGNRVILRDVSDRPETIVGYLSTSVKETNDEDQGERIGSACLGFGDPASAPRNAPLVSDVAARLTSVGAAPEGWKLTRSAAISSDGTVLVGNGIDPDGNSQAWIARLP